MIKICAPYLEKKGKTSFLLCDVYIDHIKHTIWFSVEERYETYLCVERADAYVIGFLNYAMRNNHDIVCEVPVTEDLLYNINTDLIPTLAKHSRHLHHIQICADIAPALHKGFAVGTGASFGVDSFSAIRSHTNTMYPNLDITHLCINNVGAFNECYSQYGQEQVKEERYVIAEQIADELGIKLIKTDSNFATEIYQNHLQTHTYSSVFAVYCLQKLWRIYYYGSSGEDYSVFSVVNSEKKSPAMYELLALQCFSIPGLRIFSEGGAKTRIEKTMELVDYQPAQKYLHVCLSKPYNCGVCSKCKRTLVSLDLLGVLDRFEESFDIAYYKKNRLKYLLWLCRSHFERDVMNEPVYIMFLEQWDFRMLAIGAYLLNLLLFPFRFATRVIRFIYRRIGK